MPVVFHDRFTTVSQHFHAIFIMLFSRRREKWIIFHDFFIKELNVFSREFHDIFHDQHIFTTNSVIRNFHNIFTDFSQAFHDIFSITGNAHTQPHCLPSWRLHLWSPQDGNRLCILSFALPRERYPPGRYWRAGPYLYGSNAAS